MYIFYDTETSGLERDFAQVLQIGLVFTDDDLNILSSKKIDCRRSPWVVPAPGALLTTGFTPDDLKNSKNSNFEMMQEIDQWVRAQYWPVIFAGYNSLGYDEDVLAQNFHMNLLEPRLTEAANPSTGERNSRFDVMYVVQAVLTYSPGALKLDILNEAKPPAPSLKLTNVAAQNGVSLGAEDAHDAMNDIKATVGVAKVCKKVAPQIWDHMHTLATQAGVESFISKNKVFTHTANDFGRMKPMVATAVTARGNRTEILFDLSQDPAPYLSMTAEQLKDVLLQQDKKPGKGAKAAPKPFRLVRKDTQPVMMPMEMSDAVLPARFDDKLAGARADAIKADKTFQENLRQAAQLVKALKASPAASADPSAPVSRRVEQPEELLNEEPKPELRQRLDQWMGEFRGSTSWRQAAGLVEDFYKRFDKDLGEDPSIRRFVKFAGRIVFEHAPEELSEQKQDQMKRYIAAHILTTDLKVPWMTVPKARRELAEIEKQRAEGKKKWGELTDTQLRSLKLYYTSLEKEYAPYLAPAAGSNDNDKTAPAAPAPEATDKPPAPGAKKSANDSFRP